MPKGFRVPKKFRALLLESLENRVNPATFLFANGNLEISLGDLEIASLISNGQDAYSITLNSPFQFNGTDQPGLSGNGSGNLTITNQLTLDSIRLDDKASTNANHGVNFTPSANAYGVNVSIAFSNANGVVTVATGNQNINTAFSANYGLSATGVNQIVLEKDANLITENGSITLTTATYPDSASGAGVSLGQDSAIQSTGFGSITIDATASPGNSTDGAIGLDLAKGAAIVTANSPISLTAKSAPGSQSHPVDISVGSGSGISAGGGSTLLFKTDTLSVDPQAWAVSSATGTVQFQTRSASRDITLGDGGNGLTIDTTTINLVQAASLVFGGKDSTGNFSSTKPLAPASSGNITLHTGGEILVNAPITSTGSLSLTGGTVKIAAALDTAGSGNGGGVAIVSTTGVVDIQPAGDIASGGPVDIKASTEIRTAGNITAPNQAVTYHSKVVLTGTVKVNTEKQGPYSIPIYQMQNNGSISFAIYASINGGPMLPYLLDTGSPNFFPTYGSWWPGTEVPTASTPPGQYTQTYASGATYTYNIANVAVSLGSKTGSAVTPAVQANVGQVITTGTQSALECYTNWASNYSKGGASFGDGTFGNFGAGLYGSSTLATILAQLPLSPDLKPGFIVRSGGANSAVGELIVGLSKDAISAFPNPMTMDPSGNNLPNAFGLTVPGYGAAQVATTQVTLSDSNGVPYVQTMPTVFDTGGGPNNVIYQNQSGPNAVPGSFVNGGSSTGGVVKTGLNYSIQDSAGRTVYSVTTGDTGNVNKTVVDPQYNVGLGYPRLNPGVAIFLTNDVMYNLGDGTLGLIPTPVTIPLQLVNIGTEANPSYKLGIYIGLGGGAPKLYEFDTGAAGFFAAYDPNHPENTSWWSPDSFSNTGQAAQMNYTSGMEYNANVVTTQVTLYAKTSSGLVPAFNLPGTPLVGQIQNAVNTKDPNYDYSQLLQEGKAPVEQNFWGDFGMALYRNSSGGKNMDYSLYAIIPQAGPVTGTLGSGFIISTGGYDSPSPVVQVGLNALDRLRFTNYSAMNPPSGSTTPGTFPVGGGPSFDFAITNGLLTLESVSGSLIQAMPLVMDTGAPKSVLHAFGTIVAPSDDAKALDLLIPGTKPTDGMFQGMSFETGKPHSLNGFAVDTTPNPNTPNGYLNTGINLFFRNDVMYDLQGQKVGFYSNSTPVAGNVTFFSTVDGEYDLAINAGAGTVSMGGSVGSSTALGSFTVELASSTTLGGVHAESISISSPSAALSGNLNASKTLLLDVPSSLLQADVVLTGKEGISVEGAINGQNSTEPGRTLSLDAGDSGSIQIDGMVGSITPLGGLVVVNGNRVTFAGSLTVTAGGGQVTVHGATHSVEFEGDILATSFVANNSLSPYGLTLGGVANTFKGVVSLANYPATFLDPGQLTAGTGLLLGTGKLGLTINGSETGEFSAMAVGGPVRISGTELALFTTNLFIGAPGTQFTVLNNQSNTAIVGTFNGLPEGGTVSLRGMDYAITYTGGDGNDIVLTCLRQIPSPNGPQVANPFTLGRRSTVASLGNGQVGIWSTDGNYQTITPFPGYYGPLTVNTVNRSGGPTADSIVVGVAGKTQPHVLLIDATTGRVAMSIFAFAPQFMGGVNVAGGVTQINGAVTSVLLFGAGSGSEPSVSVFDAVSGQAMGAFYAFAGPYQGGVRVALSQPDPNGMSLAIVGSSVNSHVAAFDLSNYYQSVLSFYAFQDLATPGGVYVASADLDGNGFDEIVVGVGEGATSPQVSIFSANGGFLNHFLAFAPSFKGGVRVGVSYNDEIFPDILAASGPGAQGTLNSFSYPTFELIDSAFISDSLLGVDVASNYSSLGPI